MAVECLGGAAVGEDEAERLSVLSVGKYLETDIVSCGVLEALDHTDLPHV